VRNRRGTFQPIREECIHAALECLDNRGPDGHGVYRGGPVTLIHSRLSIIDLSEHAAQPMVHRAVATLSFLMVRYIIIDNSEN